MKAPCQTRGMVVLLLLILGSCGYHVGGRADLLPKGVHTIAIPAFSTLSTRYKVVDELPQEISREFNTRTRFRAVENPADADAVLNGNVNTVVAFPILVDPSSAKASGVQLVVNVSVNLNERATGRVLFSRANWIIHENYEIAADPHQYLDESGPAMDRLSRDLAHDLVSAVVENF